MRESTKDLSNYRSWAFPSARENEKEKIEVILNTAAMDWFHWLAKQMLVQHLWNSIEITSYRCVQANERKEKEKCLAWLREEEKQIEMWEYFNQKNWAEKISTPIVALSKLFFKLAKRMGEFKNPEEESEETQKMKTLEADLFHMHWLSRQSFRKEKKSEAEWESGWSFRVREGLPHHFTDADIEELGDRAYVKALTGAHPEIVKRVLRHPKQAEWHQKEVAPEISVGVVMLMGSLMEKWNPEDFFKEGRVSLLKKKVLEGSKYEIETFELGWFSAKYLPRGRPRQGQADLGEFETDEGAVRQFFLEQFNAAKEAGFPITIEDIRITQRTLKGLQKKCRAMCSKPFNVCAPVSQ